MPTYKVVGKHIFRATTQDIQMGTRMDGSPNIVRQPGVMQRVEVGTLLDDVHPEELATAPDRFELVEEAAVQAMVEAGSDPSLAMNAPLRGVYEPASDPDAVVHKPPLTGAEVEAHLAAQGPVRKLETAQSEQQRDMEKALEEAKEKARTETLQQASQAMQRQRQAAKAGQGPAPQGALPVSTSGDAPRPAPAAPGEQPAAASGESPPPSDAAGGTRRRP